MCIESSRAMTSRFFCCCILNMQRYEVHTCQFKKYFMKYLLIIIFCFLNLFACKKSPPIIVDNYSNTIGGKWNYFQTYFSSGGPITYNSTAYLKQWVNFERDSTFSSNVAGFEKFSFYSLEDSFKVKFTSAQFPERLYFFKIDSIHGTLSLSPADYLCIEGCGDIFKK